MMDNCKTELEEQLKEEGRPNALIDENSGLFSSAFVDPEDGRLRLEQTWFSVRA